MIYTSLVLLAMATSTAAFGSLPNPIHLHPHMAQADHRICVTLYNKSLGFREVKVDGRTYTMQGHERLTLKAPAGTVVYAGSPMPFFHAGAEIFHVDPKLDNTRVDIN